MYLQPLHEITVSFRIGKDSKKVKSFLNWGSLSQFCHKLNNVSQIIFIFLF